MITVHRDSNYQYTAPDTSTVLFGPDYAYVMSHDAAGAREWVVGFHRTTSSGVILPRDVVVAADGSIYIAVSGSGTYRIGTSDPFALSHVGIVKLSPTGELVWYRGGDTDSTYSSGSELRIVMDASRIAVVGSTGRPVRFEGTTIDVGPDNLLGFVSIYDLDGAHQTFYRMAGVLEHASLREGVLSIAGYFRDRAVFGGTVLTTVGSDADLFFANLDFADGTPRAAHGLGTAEDDYLYGMERLPGGDTVLSTNTAELVRITPTGAIVWYTPAGETFTSLVVDDDGDLWTFARTSSTETMIRRVGADGVPNLELTLDGLVYDLAIRGRRIAIAGAFRGYFRMGGVVASRSNAAGLFAALMEVP